MHFCFASHALFPRWGIRNSCIWRSAGSYTKKKKEKLWLRFSQAIQVQIIKNNQQKIREHKTSFSLYSSWETNFFVTPWTADHQDPRSVGFSRQEHWSGLPCPPPGDLPDPGVKSQSPALAGRLFFTIWATREALEEGAIKRYCPGFWIISL